jgi:dihydrodipicolinate synthase/N-acetylneuraminate lyase
MFGKIITAVVTPFDEMKNIDYESFKKNFSYDARNDAQKNTLDQWFK